MSLNTIQANWNEMFLIFHQNGQTCKLQVVSHKVHSEVKFQYLAKEVEHFGINQT